MNAYSKGILSTTAMDTSPPGAHNESERGKKAGAGHSHALD